MRGSVIVGRRPRVEARRIVLVALLVALVSGCSGGEEATTVPSATTGAPYGVVAVEEFAAVLDHPRVVVVNVHAPDEGELPATGRVRRV